MFTLEKDGDGICKLLLNSPSCLRILLKTKDDELFIEKWILHYSGIVEKAADIIIFDNCSTNRKVLEIYEKYRDRITVIQFSCYFNSLHVVSLFPHIYAALFASSKFYIFVDTDEFLHLYDGEKALADKSIPALLENSPEVSFFPTFWLKNDLFRHDVFVLKRDLAYMRYLAVMGKPLLNTATARRHLRQMTIHALQMPVSVYETGANAPCRFLLFHVSTISKNHRISVNMNKLAQHGMIKDARDFQTVLSIDVDGITHGTFRYFVCEIRRLLAMPDTVGDTVGPDHLALLPDGGLQFFPPTAKKFFDKFINKDSQFFSLLGVSPADARRARSALIWELYDKEGARRGIAPQMRWEM